ncbi:Adaptor for signal transduction [Mortierella sp. NVP85]|nr:Adaptor for signal transduction [Mortierella sp. NVP85]
MESITQWDPNRVHQWMRSIGFPNYEKQIKDNGISGELLVHLDHAALKDLSIWEVGKRLTILKAIYHLKLSYGISLEAGDYVPPSVAFENEYNNQAASSLKIMEQAVHDKDNMIQHLVREVERMSKDLDKVKDELYVMQKDQKPLPEPSTGGYAKSVNGQTVSSSSSSSSSSMLSASSSSMLSASSSNHITNFMNAPSSPIHATHGMNSVRSPGFATDSGFHSIPSSPHSPAETRGRSNTETGEDGKAGADGAGAIKVKPSSADAFRSFRISQDDPCHKVLPAALKKYKINDDWQKYALFICYGTTERILTYNEKPLLLMKQLKENKESPVFMLKHIKQMKSPAVNTPTPPSALPPRKDLMNKELPVPPYNMSASASQVTLVASSGASISGGLTAQSNGSTLTLGRTGATTPTTTGPTTTTTTTTTSSSSSSSSSTLNGVNGNTESSSSSSTAETFVQETVEASGTAVALYEWEAKRDDELNVKVGDVFKIKGKGHGWWIVQRDDEIGWIPASILSEGSSEDQFFDAEGVAIFDFTKTGPNELSIKTGDKLKIFRRYQHWLLATCEGQRGWVPSWFVSLDPQ